MMNLLPPVGWWDIPSKADLELLAREMRSEMAQLRSEVRVEIANGQAKTIPTIVLSMLASNATLVGLVFAITQL